MTYGYAIGWVLFLGSMVSSACLWDSDTVRDSLAAHRLKNTNANTQMYDMIMGQLPSHGAAYYQAKEAKLQGRSELSREDKLNLAVAKIRLGKLADGRKILEALQAQDPKHYETLSNLGVLAKKEKRFDASVEFLNKALGIKPEGHMGLGDWYVKRVEFERDLQKAPGGVPSKNFLGEAYDEMDPARLVNKSSLNKRGKMLSKLIYNDRHFADGYLALGDVLFKRGDFDFAMRAYQHARHLEHPNPKAVHERIHAVASHWNKHSSPTKDAIARRIAKERQVFDMELREAKAWVADFHKVESRRVGAGELPSFKQTRTLQEMKPYRPTIGTKSFLALFRD